MNAALLELRLLGPVLAYVLERRGVPMLHASVIDAQGRALGILSGHGGGKTCLAATLVAAGHSLLADDVLAAEPREDGFYAQPAYPWLRMAPAAADHFLGREARHLDLVHPDSDKYWISVADLGAFAEHERPLRALFLPERSTDPAAPIEVEPLRPARALIELVRHSFLARLVEAMGLQKSRLDSLARLARTVPMFRLRHPAGFEPLPRVAERLLEQL